MVAKMSFLIAFIVLIVIGIFMLLSAYGPMTAIVLIVLDATTLVIALMGVILGGLSFRKGKNAFGITGFILNIILVGVISGAIFQAVYLLQI